MAMTMPVLHRGEEGGGGGVVMDGRPDSDLLGHSAFTSWNRQGLINSRAQRINYNKSKMISEHLD